MTEETNKEKEVECPMCGGEGGWPHPLRPGGFEKCKPCKGTGKDIFPSSDEPIS